MSLIDESPLLRGSPGFERKTSVEFTHTDKGIRLLVLTVVLITELLVNILMAALVPFFPDHAEQRLGAGPTLVGIIFALYPLAVLVSSPVVGWASATLGRAKVFLIGLMLLGLGTLQFGLSSTVAECCVGRVVSGLGGACINVAGMALLMQVSVNLDRDVGLDQAAAGLGYILGPPLGGGLYSLVGFRWLFIGLSVLPLAEALALPLIARHIPAPRLHAARAPYASMLTWPVVLVSTTLLVAYTSMGFFDPLLSQHLQRSLGVSTNGVGALFVLPSVAYTLVSACSETSIRRLGHKGSIGIGLGVTAAAYVILGPVPFLLDLPWNRTLAWVVQFAALILFGFGFSFALVAAVPMMRAYLPHVGHEKDDFVSSVNSLCGSAGGCLGPFLGGLASELLPQRREVTCRESATVASCESGMSYSTLAFALGILPFLVLFLACTPAPPKEPTRRVSLAAQFAPPPGIPHLPIDAQEYDDDDAESGGSPGTSVGGPVAPLRYGGVRDASASPPSLRTDV